jgi:hypothetical protein
VGGLTISYGSHQSGDGWVGGDFLGGLKRERGVYNGSILLGSDGGRSSQRRRSCLQRMGRRRLCEAKIVGDVQWDSVNGDMANRRECGVGDGQATFPVPVSTSARKAVLGGVG